MIGDRMDTDIVAGMEVGRHTVLVMIEISSRASIADFAFRPNQIVNGVYELLDDPVDRDDDSQ